MNSFLSLLFVWITVMIIEEEKGRREVKKVMFFP
jgi:hypothetical protein